MSWRPALRRASLRSSFVRLAVVVSSVGLALAGAPTAVLPAAQAATCTTSGGVSVVVDFRELGGAMVTSCVSDGGGKSAAAIFAAAGVSISYATRQPGFVCRVNGAPASDPCVNTSPADAFWGLWWADGSRASWSYSSSGVGGLTVPAGGSVGWSWQQDRAADSTAPPGATPPVIRAAPSVTPTPTPSSPPTKGGGKPGAGKSDGGKSGGGAAHHGGASSTPGSSPTASASPSTSTPTTESESPMASPTTKAPKSKSGRPAAEASASDPPSTTATVPPEDTVLGEPTASTADEPTRIPAPVTWGIVALLAISVVASALFARRRRGAGGS